MSVVCLCVFADFICGKMLCQFERQPSISSPSPGSGQALGRWGAGSGALECVDASSDRRKLCALHPSLGSGRSAEYFGLFYLLPEAHTQQYMSVRWPALLCSSCEWMMNERIYQRPLVGPPCRQLAYAGWCGDTSQLIYWG